MLTKEKKLQITDEIIHSKTFQKATTSSALLKYLVKAEIEDTFLKEDIIDLDFFGSKGKADKSSTRVRVSMYNLRKKLQEYYDGEGEDKKHKLAIEKGQYVVSYEQEIPPSKAIGDYFNKNTISYAILGLIIITLAITTLPPKKPAIWKDFLNKDKGLTLFIGDAFGLKGETITGPQGFTRDYSINNIEDFYELLERKPELKNKLTPSNYQYFTNMGATASRNIAQLFSPYNKDFDIKYNSNTTFDEIKAGNSIYVGPLLNENKFIGIFNDANPGLTISKYWLEIKNHPTLADTTMRISTSGQKIDFAIVSKIPGPMGTEQMLFFSNHDMGVSATIEYFTNKDSISAFSKQYLKDHKYFTAIYKASGEERTSLNLETMMVIPF